MSFLALSVLLSLVSAVAYAAGAIVQERVATAGDGRSLTPLRNRVWWVAVALNGVGAVLHVLALAYGPLSLVQPLGALTIVFALPMAALFVRRQAGATAWRGAIMTTVGLAGLLALTGSGESHTLDGPEQFMLATVTFGAVALLLVVSRGMQKPVVRSMVLAGAAGVAFGIASVFTKTVAMEWTSGAVGAGLPSLVVIAALAGAGLLLSQAAYRGAGLTAPLATVTVVNPVIAAAVGITLFGEEFRHGTAGTVLALACGVVAAGGLIMLTTERMSAEQRIQGIGAAASEMDAGVAAEDMAGATEDPESAVEPAAAVKPAGALEFAGALVVHRPQAEPAWVTPAVSGSAATESIPSLLPPPVTLGGRRAGRVEFGPAPRPRTGSRRRGLSAAEPDDPAQPLGSVQTLTPPALR
ncbi:MULTISPECIES: DMT family transporter [unclassified Streptomyces]|uniref:DMT family transporter n=1 Tax=Streptomyces sp. NBC_01669 TaxID=2975909 RepID=UPI00225AB997|nr:MULTISPECIES: DMT family transporter [unclassified Streptomyces]MCX4530738.1 DMT family transporter [Streptomyces sp. NBC_01669]